MDVFPITKAHLARRSAEKAAHRAAQSQPRYLRLLRLLPCAVRFAQYGDTRPAGEVHHCKRGRFGMAMRTPDWSAIPLSHAVHMEAENAHMHTDDWILQHAGVEPADLAAALWAAYENQEDLFAAMVAAIPREKL